MARNLNIVYHHVRISDIVADIVYDYNGICAMTNDQLPLGLSELKPGIKEILRTWNEMRNSQHVEQLNKALAHVQYKNHKHLHWLRFFIWLCAIETFILCIWILI
jgi:hypothetical protein